ncbi:MAG TPA: class I SAM-dependent methyltransferase [Sphingomicrobium sp.]|nr:class I SAM-dependent methyltransferase [Sphingomicrobium sp.]
MSSSPICTVCREGELGDFAHLEHRRYHRCPLCLATLLAAEHLPPPEIERAHYLHHENDVDDPRYRAFASKLVEPLAGLLWPGATGLDYGCGPGPVAAAMLRERGFEVELFDPFFAPDESLLERRYDFIICSEVVEHFHRPADEFDRLGGLLEEGGVLAIMTCFQDDDGAFARWHYRRDPTHVAFYRAETFAYVASQRGWSCQFPAKDVALIRRS